MVPSPLTKSGLVNRATKYAMEPRFYVLCSTLVFGFRRSFSAVRANAHSARSFVLAILVSALPYTLETLDHIHHQP